MTACHDHWMDHAEQWQHIGPPLRPSCEDVELAESLAAEVAGSISDRSFHSLLLGVTPELAQMHWPQSTRLVAIDRNRAMIEKIWPAEALTGEAQVLHGDWNALPLSDKTVDFVIGDGCFTTIESPAGYIAVLSEIHRVLKPEGRSVLRFFVRPERKEAPSEIFEELNKGSISSFHILKLRLAMSLQESFAMGVRVGAIWEAWHSEGLNVSGLSARHGWPIEEIESINAYEGVEARYTFPSIDELRDILALNFHEIGCYFPGYELGERCPTFVISPRKHR